MTEIKALLQRIFRNRKKATGCFAWLYQQTGAYRLQLLVLVCLRCIATVLSLSLAVISKWVIDRATTGLTVAPAMALMVAGYVCSIGLSMSANWFFSILSEKYAFHLRTALFDKLMHKQWQSLQPYHSESLLTRLTSDVDNVTGGIANLFASLVALIVQFIGAFILLAQYDVSLAVFAAVLGPVGGLLMLLFAVKLRGVQKNYQEAEAVYRSFLQESLAQISIVKAFCYEEKSLAQLQELRKRRLYWVRRKNAWNLGMNLGINAVFTGSYLFAFVSGAKGLAAGTITYGTMTAFLSLVGQIQSPVANIANTMPQIVSVLASADRLMELDRIPAEQQTHSLKTFPTVPLGVRGNHLAFVYPGTERIVLEDFSFDIAPGTIAAVMGPSGVGKTTLARMILNFITPQKGSVALYDGAGQVFPCTSQTRTWLSYVPADNALFSGTVAENLRMGKPDATPEEMCAALQAAQVWETVQALPQGVDTPLGEDAARLSQGQAQRIAIARALIRPAALLILDEATSALDEPTERAVLQALRGNPHRPTCLVISHRPAVREFADQTITFAPRA